MTRPRVLLLAPIRATGGIASWTEVLLQHARRTTFTVEDTSRTYCAAGARQRPWHLLRGLAGGVARNLRVWRRVRCLAPDAVFATCAPSLGFLIRDVPLFFLLRALRTPVIVVLHGGDLAGYFGRGGPRTRIVLAGLRRVDRVIATTRAVEAQLESHLPAGVLRFLPNMVPDAYWRAADPAGRGPRRPGRRTVALVAWQSPVKGSLTAVAAAAQLPVDVDLLLVGEASAENAAAIDALARSVGAVDRVHRTGRLPRAEVDRILAGCDVALLPSATEGFPMAVLEAMSHGVPVVASQVGNLAEMVLGDPDRPAGILLDPTPEDRQYPVPPDRLAAAVGGLLADPARASGLGRHGRERVRERYLASRVVPQLEELIAQVALGGQTAPATGIPISTVARRWRRPT